MTMHKKKTIIFLTLSWLILFLSPSVCSSKKVYISYSTSKGRFGDNLILFFKAAWLSYKYKIPLFYRPFIHSDQLMIKNLIPPVQIPKNNIKNFHIKDESSLEHIKQQNPCLYTIDYYFNLSSHEQDKEDAAAFDNSFYQTIRNTCRTNKLFVLSLKKLILPKKDFIFPQLPKNCVTVALHVRKGSGPDFPLLSDQKNENPDKIYADRRHPLKFPPDSFYVNQLKRIYEVLGQIPLYVYIFTDYAHPEKLAKKYTQALGISDITFDFRKKNIDSDATTIEDFFFMLNFDCLIRPWSSYSISAEILGDFTIIIGPVHSFWAGTKLIIDTIELVSNGKVTYISESL